MLPIPYYSLRPSPPPPCSPLTHPLCPHSPLSRVSAMLIIFGASANILLSIGTALRATDETAILGIDKNALNVVLAIG